MLNGDCNLLAKLRISNSFYSKYTGSMVNDIECRTRDVNPFTPEFLKSTLPSLDLGMSTVVIWGSSMKSKR